MPVSGVRLGSPSQSDQARGMFPKSLRILDLKRPTGGFSGQEIGAEILE
jgi:hypothetical protein